LSADEITILNQTLAVMLGKGKTYLILIYLLLPLGTIAQNSYRISGKVTEKGSGEKLEMVAIQIKELSRWTTSNIKGEFVFNNIPKGTYTLQASSLGYQQYEVGLTINRDIDGYKLMLNQMSLGLQEVTIVARENTSLSSSSKIESAALDHVQPNSLADVMQLVPGQITLNPDMSKTNQISIRDINTHLRNPDSNSAMGTAIIMMGLQLITMPICKPSILPVAELHRVIQQQVRVLI
jgi:hypothetical protein